MFLAKFICEMVLRYNQNSQKEEEVNVLQDRINIKKALEETLLVFAVEDMMEHGRLLSLKESLVTLLDPEDKLSIKSLSLF